MELRLEKVNWAETKAVDSNEFVEATAKRHGMRGKGRQVPVEDGGYELREPAISYNSDFDPENGALSNEIICYWNKSSEILT